MPTPIFCLTTYDQFELAFYSFSSMIVSMAYFSAGSLFLLHLLSVVLTGSITIAKTTILLALS